MNYEDNQKKMEEVSLKIAMILLLQKKRDLVKMEYLRTVMIQWNRIQKDPQELFRSLD